MIILKSQIVFLRPALIVFIKTESRKDWQIFIWGLCKRPKRKQICDTLKTLFKKKKKKAVTHKLRWEYSLDGSIH